MFPANRILFPADYSVSSDRVNGGLRIIIGSAGGVFLIPADNTVGFPQLARTHITVGRFFGLFPADHTVFPADET